MTVVHWARHGENVANLSRTFSYRVFDGDLTGRGIAQPPVPGRDAARSRRPLWAAGVLAAAPGAADSTDRLRPAAVACHGGTR